MELRFRDAFRFDSGVGEEQEVSGALPILALACSALRVRTAAQGAEPNSLGQAKDPGGNGTNIPTRHVLTSFQQRHGSSTRTTSAHLKAPAG
jgi:hypothetical protein